MDFLRRILVSRHLKTEAELRTGSEAKPIVSQSELRQSQPAHGASDGRAGRKGNGGRRAKAHGNSDREGQSETDNSGWFVGGPITNPGRVPLIPMNKALNSGVQAKVCAPH